ncbi:MAG: hypothetical protein ACI841_001849 [Planctomycetota bacterium]|jgi:hypothetical protein
MASIDATDSFMRGLGEVEQRSSEPSWKIPDLIEERGRVRLARPAEQASAEL